MRFRRIEKDMGGMANVGLKDQHIQGKEDDVTTSESKTYIGSNAKKKVAMNKIKNTKVGDDIHYYINGQEGRGIVVKMANEYLEIFKENGQLGTIHINDTFFVKDILINKQWDDMDDIERYDALTKIHAPSPRYITKTWDDIPEEIKVLLTKEGGNMAGGTGSTYEKGESKDSETQDHSRTGFAQNEQYSSKKPKGCNCGDPKCKDPKCKKHKKENVEKKDPRPSPRTAHGGIGTTQSEEGQKVQANQRAATASAAGALGVDFGTATSKAEDVEKKDPRPSPRTAHGGIGTTQSEEGQKVQADHRAATSSAASALGVDFGTATSKSDAFRKLKPVYEGDTKQARDTKKAWEVWLERQEKSHDNPSRNIGRGKRKKEPLLEADKSDVEHGRYGNAAGTPEVGVSTDTKVDVTTGTGYEERPHISVEEAGKLPRATFNESGSELTVSGSQDSKDEPKFSQPADQEQPVRKAGLPQQHPNTYGVRYGMKGGVKKVWCPEHQMWEETRKDWHE